VPEPVPVLLPLLVVAPVAERAAEGDDVAVARALGDAVTVLAALLEPVAVTVAAAVANAVAVLVAEADGGADLDAGALPEAVKLFEPVLVAVDEGVAVAPPVREPEALTVALHVELPVLLPLAVALAVDEALPVLEAVHEGGPQRPTWVHGQLAGHAVGTSEPAGQKKPTGHAVQLAEPNGQYAPHGHGTRVITLPGQ
jgi:hypothetical protein